MLKLTSETLKMMYFLLINCHEALTKKISEALEQKKIVCFQESIKNIATLFSDEPDSFYSKRRKLSSPWNECQKLLLKDCITLDDIKRAYSLGGSHWYGSSLIIFEFVPHGTPTGTLKNGSDDVGYFKEKHLIRKYSQMDLEEKDFDSIIKTIHNANYSYYSPIGGMPIL